MLVCVLIFVSPTKKIEPSSQSRNIIEKQRGCKKEVSPNVNSTEVEEFSLVTERYIDDAVSTQFLLVAEEQNIDGVFL